MRQGVRPYAPQEEGAAARITERVFYPRSKLPVQQKGWYAMFFCFIMLFCSFTMYFSVMFAYKNLGETRNGRIFCVTLPPEGIREESVTNIVTKYRAWFKKSAWILLAAAIPVHILMAGYTSVFLIVYFIWSAALFMVPNWIAGKGQRELYALKQERKWTVGETRVIYVDTKAGVNTEKMPLSFLWIWGAALCSLIPVILGKVDLRLGDPGFLILVLSVLDKGIFLMMYHYFVKSPNKVYSRDSNINSMCNQSRKRIWSVCLILISYLDTGAYLFLQLEFHKSPDGLNDGGYLMIFILLEALASSLIFYAVRETERKKERILSADQEPVLVDEDEFWKTGTYYNPGDKRILVENRMSSANMAFNMARPVAKLMVYSIYAGTAVLLVWLAVMSLRMDFIPFQMEISGEQVRIQAGDYPLTIETEDIQEVSLLDSLPDKNYFRTNGAATEQYLLGKFKGEGMDVRMYVYRNLEPVICIRMPDKLIYFNTRKGMEGVYEELKALCP